MFKNGVAGRGRFNGFRSRHPRLVLLTPQPLSYSRALNSNKFVIDDFFAKLCRVYGRLNLISKPMLIYNADETGVGIVTKPGKVFAEIGRRNVYTITAAERGKTHTIMSCVSAFGSTLPPIMVYPRKRSVLGKMRAGAVGSTLFEVSDNVWINKEIFLVWLQKVWNIPFQSRRNYRSSSTCSSFKSCHPTASYFEFTRSVSVLSLDVISKMLVLSQHPERSKKGRKQAVNKTTVCITEEDILCNLKQKEADQLDKEAQKKKRKKDRKIKQHERREK